MAWTEDIAMGSERRRWAVDVEEWHGQGLKPVWVSSKVEERVQVHCRC